MSKKGNKQTEDHRRKIGLANAGKRHTEETKTKLKEIMEDMWKDKNYKNHMSEIHRGHVHSEIQKRKIGESNKGKHSITEEHLKKLNEAKYRKDIDKMKKEILDLYCNKQKGIKEISENMNCDFSVIKRIIEENNIKVRPIKFYNKGKTPWNSGKSNIYSIETIEKIKEARAKQIFPVKDTTIEVKLQNFLKQLNVEFFTHQYMNIEHGYQCDILIPSKNIVIECFGDYWHKYPVGREIDALRCQELRQRGFKVFVFWEREIKVMELNDLKNKLN